MSAGVLTRAPLRRPLPWFAILRKEVVDVVRQPVLLLVLVVLPFGVLLAFGLGYDDSPRPYRTLVVAADGNPMVDRIQQAQGDLTRFVTLEGVTSDPAVAERQLREGQVDAVAVLPDDPVATVAAGERATIQILHRRVDPIEQTLIEFAARLAADEVNAQVIATAVSEGQEAAQSLPTVIGGTVGAEAAAATDALQSVPADVLARPFQGDVVLATDGPRSITDYYAPAALALLLQQFGLAFGTLTFVRERQLGVDELYRVSPVGVVQALQGKYLAYIVLGSAVGAVLLSLMVFVLGVPLEGDVVVVALALLLVLVASIGMGFVLAHLSRSDTQAVLVAMIVLLASLFFTGFFLPVDALTWPVRAISYVLPATYGTSISREVMLLGGDPSTADVVGLCVLTAVVVAASAVATRWRVTGTARPSRRARRRLAASAAG